MSKTIPHITICDCVTERTGKPHVTFPRAEYEALRTAHAQYMEITGLIQLAHRHLAKGRSLWNGPCHQCNEVLEQALRAADIQREE